MKYDLKTKSHRNTLLCEYANDHPELSLQKVGQIFSVSKQRVWELLRQEQKRGQTQS